MILIVACLVLVLCWFVVFRYSRRRLYFLAGKMTKPSDEIPIMGVARTLMGDTQEIMMALQRYSIEATEAENGWLRGWLGHIFYCVCGNPVDLEYVLKTCLEKDDLHRFIREVTGDGGIFAPVPIWRRRRKIMVPAFSPKVLENFVSVFAEQSEKLTGRLAHIVNQGNVSLWTYLSTYTLDSVCETAMGVNVNSQGDSESPFLKHLNVILNVVCERIFHLWLHPNWLFKCSSNYRKQKKAMHHMFQFTDEVIDMKKKQISSKQETKDEDPVKPLGILSDEKKTFLELLIKISGGEQGYSSEQLREEVFTLVVAGTDTSAVSMGYTLKLLAMFPEVQEKVYQESLEVFGDCDRLMEKGDLMRLPYLERVVKESLRMFPPVPFIIRKAEKETKLPSGVIIPSNAGILIPVWGLHRDPKYWGPDAHKFDPDRFLPERFTQANTCSYLPFSSGPRNCLGYQYAMMSIKTVLSSVVRKFRVVGEECRDGVPRIRVKLDIMMKDVDGYQVTLERRNT